MNKHFLTAFCMLFLTFPLFSKSNNHLSNLIASTYLQERNLYIAKNTLYEKDSPLKEKVFGSNSSNGWAHLHDIWIDIKVENGLVIIKTKVSGTPQDFKYESVLEPEEDLLKFNIIRDFISKRALESSDNMPVSLVLDKYTKVVSHPKPEKFCYGMGWNEHVEHNMNRFNMELVTIIPMDDFTPLIVKYFLNESLPALQS
ncbi:hypothetical protein HOM50_01475 [bacterium]|jgi:hypothetical protein|nr:hypothetical protein [bacterium]MBT5015059.1 hypothetical protein [bacterium]